MWAMIGTITKIVIGVCVVALLVWTSIAVAIGGPGDSVSAHIRDYSAKFPLIPFALGVLVGHWYFYMSPPKREE